MARLISEGEAKRNADRVVKGFISPIVLSFLGKPTGFPEAFIEYESGEIEAFKLFSAPDNFQGQTTVWAGWLPRWAK
mgnify:CR=1 FL=1